MANRGLQLTVNK